MRDTNATAFHLLVEKLKARTPGPERERLLILAKGLFGKAPADWLDQAATRELEATLEAANEALSLQERTPEKPLVYRVSASGAARLFIVLRDCPFIINTITQIVRSLGLHPEVLLHPVLPVGGLQISLSYLELPAADSERVDRLQAELLNALSALLLVTRTFPQMQETLQELAASFRRQCPRGGIPEKRMPRTG